MTCTRDGSHWHVTFSWPNEEPQTKCVTNAAQVKVMFDAEFCLQHGPLPLSVSVEQVLIPVGA